MISDNFSPFSSHPLHILTQESADEVITSVFDIPSLSNVIPETAITAAL